MIEQNLKNLGMSEKEAKVYLALLQVDHASATDLSRKTDIKRPTVYVVIESLAEKGLVSETTIGKRTRFQAESPERLETYVERRRRVLEEQSKDLKGEIIPQLKGLQHADAAEPTIKFYAGKEGVISALDELLESHSPSEDAYAYVAFSRDLLKKHFSDEERNKYRQLRIARNIQTRSIYTSSDGEMQPTEKTDSVRLDAEEYPITCDISVIKNRVQISTLGEKLSGIAIHNRDVAETLRSLIRYVIDSEKSKNNKK